MDHVRGVIEDYQDNISVKNLSDDVYLKCQQDANLYQMFWKYVFSIEDNTTGQTRYPSFLEIKGRINDLRGQLNLSEEMEMGRLFEDCAESVISYIDNRLRLEQTYNINRDIPQQGSEL